MSPKLKQKLSEIEELKRKLAEAESAVKEARTSAVGKVEALFKQSLVDELRGLDVKRLTVAVGEEGVKVSLGGSVGRRGGNGKPVEIPEEGVERAYKGKTYRLTKDGETFTVLGPDGAEVGAGLSSLTAAAGAILGKTRGVNGVRWWGLAG